MKTIRKGHKVKLLRDIYRIPSFKDKEYRNFLYNTAAMYRLHLEYGFYTCKPPWYDSLYEHVIYAKKDDIGNVTEIFKNNGTWYIKVLMDNEIKTFRKTSLSRID